MTEISTLKLGRPVSCTHPQCRACFASEDERNHHLEHECGPTRLGQIRVARNDVCTEPEGQTREHIRSCIDKGQKNIRQMILGATAQDTPSADECAARTVVAGPRLWSGQTASSNTANGTLAVVSGANDDFSLQNMVLRKEHAWKQAAKNTKLSAPAVSTVDELQAQVEAKFSNDATLYQEKVDAVRRQQKELTEHLWALEEETRERARGSAAAVSCAGSKPVLPTDEDSERRTLETMLKFGRKMVANPPTTVTKVTAAPQNNKRVRADVTIRT